MTDELVDLEAVEVRAGRPATGRHRVTTREERGGRIRAHVVGRVLAELTAHQIDAHSREHDNDENGNNDDRHQRSGDRTTLVVRIHTYAGRPSTELQPTAYNAPYKSYIVVLVVVRFFNRL